MQDDRHNPPAAIRCADDGATMLHVHRCQLGIHPRCQPLPVHLPDEVERPFMRVSGM